MAAGLGRARAVGRQRVRRQSGRRSDVGRPVHRDSLREPRRRYRGDAPAAVRMARRGVGPMRAGVRPPRARRGPPQPADPCRGARRRRGCDRRDAGHPASQEARSRPACAHESGGGSAQPRTRLSLTAARHGRGCRVAAGRLRPSMPAVPSNVSSLIGRTPVLELARMTAGLDARLFAKLEMFNPGSSVKDRIGVAMIEAAEREGRIEPGRTTIVEATSGNTGIALAFVCAAKGYELVLTLPEGMSREREALLRLYGATVEVTESLGGMNEAVDAARALAARDDVFLPDQFSNPANPEAHRMATGPELWEALDGEVDVFVAGVGTGGTITGVGEALKERNPACRIVAVEPRASAVLSGR